MLFDSSFMPVKYVRIGSLKMELATQPESFKPKRTRKPKEDPTPVVLPDEPELQIPQGT